MGRYKLINASARLADGKELADNVEAEGKEDVDERQNKGNKADKEACDDLEERANELAEARAEADRNDNVEEDLNISDDSEDEAKSTAESLK